MTFEEFKTTYPIALNEQQQAAVRSVAGSTVLLAVPGSGKTTVLVTRLGYLLCCCGVSPEEILTMTYTVAATRDMRSRFATFFGEKLAARLEFRTINGVSARIIHHYERAMNRRAFSLVSDERELTALVGEIYTRVTGEYPTDSDIKSLRTAITYAKNMLLTGEELTAMDGEIPRFSAMYQAYNRTLQEREQMDYDDQMVYAHRILRQYPEILAFFRCRYRHICVDEAQDTSKIQHMIIDLLSQGSESLFMVGDEDQSIYGFRAAYPQALMSFEKNHPGARVLLLEYNYRSTKEIVSRAGAFIRKNRNRRDKKMMTTRVDKGLVKEISLRDRSAQYAYLKQVARNCDRETAVLYRDNDSALPLIDLLEREKIPYRCRQMDDTFFTHRIVRDITDIIHFARDPMDGDIFLRIYYKLGSGISKVAAEKAVALSKGGDSILDWLCQLPETSPWTKRQCRGLQTHFDNLLRERADRAVYRIVHFMGYGEYLEQRGADIGKTQILEALGASEPTPLRLLERLEELRAILWDGAAPANCPFVLSTIHSSKGLEYDRVFLLDVVDGILPKVRLEPDEKTPPEEREAYEEERRLFYVGMTRAKNELAIFTFTRPELASAFSAAIFPKKQKNIASENALQYTYSFQSDSPLADRQQMGRSIEKYAVGTAVRHRQFGTGTLVNRQGDIATIHFADGTEKRFSLSAALRSKALQAEPE